MRQAEVYNHGILAGILTEENRNSYLFRYTDTYFFDGTKPAISIGISKTQQEHHSRFLFPFFSNMAAEGTNLDIQSRYLKLDENDTLSLLALTAASDSIGSVTIKLIKGQ